MPLLHNPLLALLYIISFVLVTLIFKVPFWMLISLRRSTRPRASWSVKKCLHIYLLRDLVPLFLKLGVVPKRDLTREVPDSKLQNAKFIWVDGIDDNVFTGEVKKFAERTGVKPMKIPGYWLLKKGCMGDWTPKAKDGEKVIYHLHGGGYWFGTAHPSDSTARITRGLMAYAKTILRTFPIDYRLSASAPFKAENPFPASLLDALAGYQYSIQLGFRAENIILAEDSAGGNLAMALIRHFNENKTPLEKPGKLLLLSPWGDMSASRVGPNSSRMRNAKTDIYHFNSRGLGAYGVKSYLGTELNWEEAKTNRYLSPSSPHLGKGGEGIFEGFPRTYILVGGAEWLLDDAEVIEERMARDCVKGKDWVTLDVVEDAVHDLLVFPWHEPERNDAFWRTSRWIDE